MQTPSDDDWPPPDPEYLDEAWAYKSFHGKTFEEAVALFEDNAIVYQEDLGYMPLPAFRFYLRAYMTYLMSEAARGDCDGASCFVRLIRFKAEHDREILVPNWPDIEPVLKHLVEHQDDYEANWEIYGSFRALAREIVDCGFAVTFDTDAAEIVPESISIGAVSYPGLTTSWPVALQLFQHSGFERVAADSRRPDILRIFGPPDASGGGDHPQFGHIPDWILYYHKHSTIRFEFHDDSITRVSFTPPRGSKGIPPGIEKFLSPETVALMARLHAPLIDSDPSDRSVSTWLDALRRFDKLWP